MITLFEKNTPRRVHYAVFWFLSGIIAVLIQEFLLWLFKENGLFTTRVILTFVIMSGIPIGYIILSRYFQAMLKSLDNIFELPSKDWITLQTKNIFSLSSKEAKMIFVLTILIVTTLCLTILPFSIILRIVISILALPLSFIGAHAVYTSLGLLNILQKMVGLKSKAPFYTPLNIVISPVSKFCSFAATGSLLLYGLHVIALWAGSLISNSIIMAWTITTAFFPLGMYLVSFYVMHQMMGNTKLAYIKEINYQINSMLKTLKNDPKKEYADSLDKMMEIQRKIEAMQEWPFAIEGIFTLIITTLIPIIQIGISIYDKFTP